MDPRIHSLHRPLVIPGKNHPPQGSRGASFQEVLQETQGIKISKHAKKRLVDRNISISDSSWSQIASKMNEAKEKGVTDSLVVTKDAALLVSTKNQTVVTALSREESKAQIFTNINGTIFIND
ncbi:TIGR02530 family flagellar biosynthesis protein [Halobacillus litoralis]|uniref:TIGR02530 family flagellar biosynthesis protein n=1 Tax=Halobacillus litoralis TaxID=45668 RepID=UPI001CFF47D5|nr:TIGR02530 family flagellar biosynthesis protein [Halobacillus litoralis]